MKVKVLCLLLLIFSAGLMLSSCKDKENAIDNPYNPDEEMLEKGSEKGEALLSILSYTAGLDSLPDNWYENDYTVEPIVGVKVDESNPYVRYVSVTDAEEAYATYKSMISEDLTGEAKNDAWKMDGIGSLNFKVSDQSDVIATVDVSVQQLPHLTQIRFVPASALGDNSSWFSGDPYYQFGDIVRDSQGAYWICARPASKAASKSTTHWISFNLVDGNFKEYKKDGYATLILPDTLGNKSGSEKNIVNFFELLSALGKIQRNETVQDLKIGDVTLSSNDIKFISYYWESKNIFTNSDVFPDNVLANMNATLGTAKEDIHAFYFGHHGGNTPDVHLLTTSEKNFTNVQKEKLKFSWPKGNDVTWNFKNYLDRDREEVIKMADLECKDKNKKMPERAFIVRYKTGAELSGKRTLFGNDYEPGKSFVDYSTTGIKDFLVSSKPDDSKRTYILGNLVSNGDDGRSYVCVKSSSSLYLCGDAVNSNALFIYPTYYENLTHDVSKEEIKILMFNMLNAYLAHELDNAFSAYPNYLRGLLDIYRRIELSKFITKENDVFEAKLCIRNTRYTFSFSEKEGYKFSDEDGDFNAEYPRITIISCKDDGQHMIYPIEEQMSGIDAKKSADEAAKMYNTIR